jgi:hypothetical protein
MTNDKCQMSNDKCKGSSLAAYYLIIGFDSRSIPYLDSRNRVLDL